MKLLVVICVQCSSRARVKNAVTSRLAFNSSPKAPIDLKTPKALFFIVFYRLVESKYGICVASCYPLSGPIWSTNYLTPYYIDIECLDELRTRKFVHLSVGV